MVYALAVNKLQLNYIKKCRFYLLIQSEILTKLTSRTYVFENENISGNVCERRGKEEMQIFMFEIPFFCICVCQTFYKAKQINWLNWSSKSLQMF